MVNRNDFEKENKKDVFTIGMFSKPAEQVSEDQCLPNIGFNNKTVILQITQVEQRILWTRLETANFPPLVDPAAFSTFSHDTDAIADLDVLCFPVVNLLRTLVEAWRSKLWDF